MTVISVCPAPGCDKEIHGDSTCCIKHWKQLPRGLREKYVDNPDSYMWKIWFQKAQCVWRGVPKGLISHAVIHADLDAAIASAIEAAEYAKSRRGGLLSCPHATVREIVHLGEPFTYEYQCVDCKAMLDVDPDEYAEYQAGERDDFSATTRG